MERDPRSIPKGRGALLKALAAKKEEKEVRPGGDQASGEPSKEELPKPRGRAALLLGVRERKAAQAAIGAEFKRQFGEQIVFVETETTQAAQAPCISTVLEKNSIVHEEPLNKSKVSSLPQKSESAMEKQTAYYKGESGKRVPVNANYIRMEIEPGKGVFEYHMDLQPSVDARSVRCKLLRTCIEQMGNVRDFDGGSCLYLPIRLPQDVTVFDLQHPNDGSPISMIVTFKKEKKLGDCIHLFNVLFKRVMKELKFKLMGKNHFDPYNPHMIPQHRLEILPGYAVAVDEYEGGLMVCLDVQHRVLRTQTALQLMDDLRQHPDKSRWKEQVIKALLGAIVLTKYNNNTYRVDEVLWDLKPTEGFKTSSGNKITFIDYYKQQYGLEITNLSQPLLLNLQKRKRSMQAEEEDVKICLIPEFCWLTGLTDEMRSDFKVMRDVAEFTRITPQQRKNSLTTYLRSVNNSPEARQILANWGITITGGVIDLEARILDPEMVMFGRGQSVGTERGADWSKDQMRQTCIEAIDINDWVIVHTVRDVQVAKDLSSQFVQFSKTMGCRIAPARLYTVKSDRTNEYVSASQEVIRPNVQAIVYIFGSQREDLYSAVKKICCASTPIASQVVLSRNLSNPKKSRTVMIKLALQLNCKLGGALWALKFPCKTWMVIGIDVYHSPKSKQSVLGFVSSSNPTFTCWFSQAEFQDRELSNILKMMFTRALEHFRNVNASFPTQVVIFRDSVGEGQFEYCNRHEVGQFEEVLHDMNLNNTRVTVIIVQKRINTRLIMPHQGTSNPPPGTIVDHTITKRYYNDFFLVPQSVTQGTVTPTHYVVIHDPAGHKVDNIQRLTFKLCHMYYNWSGTIRVPAPCQYAHKLAGLVGQYIGKQPDPSLRHKLYYL